MSSSKDRSLTFLITGKQADVLRFLLLLCNLLNLLNLPVLLLNLPFLLFFLIIHHLLFHHLLLLLHHLLLLLPLLPTPGPSG